MNQNQLIKTMKQLLLIFCYLLSLSALAEDEILLKSGIKETIKTNTFKVDYNERKISYQTNSNKEVTLHFEDFDWVTVGVNKFQSFMLEGSSVSEGYFVLSETATKKLIFRTTQDEDSSLIKYVFYVIDNNNNILDYHSFDNGTSKKSITQRSEIFLKIRYYFADCTDMIQRLELYDQYSTDMSHSRIVSFFKTPIYYNCTSK